VRRIGGKIVKEFYGLKHDGFDDIVGNFEYIIGGLLAEFDDICREIFKYIVGGSWRSLRKSFWIL
jgi:hypothetical protein